MVIYILLPVSEMSDEGYTDEALLHDGDESAAGAIADDDNGGDTSAETPSVGGVGDDPELEAIKARVKQGRRRQHCDRIYIPNDIY